MLEVLCHATSVMRYNTVYLSFTSTLFEFQVVMARRKADGGLVGLQLTRDHTALDPAERERLTAAGARVIDARVNGQLEVSRSFGDYQFKRQGVTCLPDVLKYQLVGERDRWVLFSLICDCLSKKPEESSQ